MNTGIRAKYIAHLKLLLALCACLCLLACAGGIRIARLTLFVSGNTMGYLENCGCSGGQSGGVHRRARIVNEEKLSVGAKMPGDRGKPNGILLLDCGNFSEPTDPVKRLLSKGVVQSMVAMKYDSVGIGLNELGFNQQDLLALLSNGGLPYTAANLELSKPAEDEDHSAALRAIIKPYLILRTAGGFRLGLVHIIDNTAVTNGRELESGYRVTDPVAAAAGILAAHRKEADLWVLTASDVHKHGLRTEEIARLTEFTIVFNVADGNPLESRQSTEVLYPFFIDPLYEKGKDLIETTITFKKDGKLAIVGQKFGVKDTYRPDPEIKLIIDALKSEQEQLEVDLVNTILGENKEVEHPVYLGYQACYGCHRPIVEQLASSRHMQAYQTLKTKGKEHTSCAKCHNVGFNRPGGWNVVKDREMGVKFFDKRNVQCENCHGPGEYHVMKQRGSQPPPDFLQDGRDEQGLLPASEQTCIQCHFGENDPHFNFKTYWPKIAHGLEGPTHETVDENAPIAH